MCFMSKLGLRSGNPMRIFLLVIILFLVVSFFNLSFSIDDQFVGYANTGVQECGCSKCHSIELDGCAGCHNAPSKGKSLGDGEDAVPSEGDSIITEPDKVGSETQEDISSPEKQSNNNTGLSKGGETPRNEGVLKGKSK